MDMQASELLTPSPANFDHILEDTIENTIPASLAATPERRAKRLADARAEFAAFNPQDAGDARLAAFAIASMLGAVDSLERAALPGVGGEATGRFRGNALANARFYKSTLAAMRKRSEPVAEPRPNSKKSDAPPEEFKRTIPYLEVFQPRDRRGKPIPRWRNELLTRKQICATYSPHDKPAWDIAREEEDAAIAAQAILDAEAGITNTDPNDFLTLRKPPPTDPPASG
jgi:hypothetical protein